MKTIGVSAQTWGWIVTILSPMSIDLDRTSALPLDIWSGTDAPLPAALTSRPAIVKEGVLRN